MPPTLGDPSAFIHRYGTSYPLSNKQPFRFHLYSTSGVFPSSKFSPATRSGMSSSSSSSFAAPSSPFSFCSDEYDSASLRRDARESGPSWLRMPGTNSVSSLSSPLPYNAKVLEGIAPCTGNTLVLAIAQIRPARASSSRRSVCGREACIGLVCSRRFRSFLHMQQCW